MAREKMFTREISYTKAIAMVCNVATASVEKECFTIPFETTDPSKMLTYLHKNVQKPDKPIVSIVSYETITKLYGCTVEEFLTVAKELDENRKVIEQ